MVQDPYVTNNILRHDIGGAVVATAPCGLRIRARVTFPGFEQALCPKCFPLAADRPES